MPVPPEEIYRDAADWRISWQDALQWTRVIDEEGHINQPVSESEKAEMKDKIDSLRNYSKTVNDAFLKEILQKLEYN